MRSPRFFLALLVIAGLTVAATLLLSNVLDDSGMSKGDAATLEEQLLRTRSDGKLPYAVRCLPLATESFRCTLKFRQRGASGQGTYEEDVVARPGPRDGG
jgi:hypothetical protein